MSMLEINHLYKSYDGSENYVLEDLNLKIEENEFVVIVGKSGGGKSTLLNLLAGFIKPDRGDILLNGQSSIGPSANKGVVFQEHGLFPWCTVLENVAMGPKLNKNKDKNKIAQELIELVGLKGYENLYPASLSGGMAQRVGIARALATNPDLLLMDEPLGALDPLTRTKMRDEILKIWKETKKTVVFITHSVSEAVYLADRVIVLKKGQIVKNEEIHLPKPRDARNIEFLSKVEELEDVLLERQDDYIEGEAV